MRLFASVICLCSALFTGAVWAQSPQAESPTGKSRALSVAQLQSLLVGKTLHYDTNNGGACSLNFNSNGTAYSHCAGGSGSGKYEIGELGTKGEKEGKLAPRYCVFYTQQGLDTYCTAMYLDEAGVYWQHARRQKIKKID
jgi:hypothetical protein